ncbi:hypothetical protein JCM8097_008946 [Rhodosporidiobolus ruineniae]
MHHPSSNPEFNMPRSLPLPTTSQVASTTSTVLNHTIPEFYACYLLRSFNKLRGGTYIGSTPDPPRRFKQHSGEITGGAWKTQRGRPWEMEGIVYGFPSKLQALQFEWAWQNPHASRHLHAPPSFLSTASYTTAKEKEKEKPTAQFPKSALSNKPLTKVQVLQFMLTVPPWRAFGLKVLLFSDDAKGWWDEARRLGPTARTEAGVRKWKAERGKKGTVGDDPWGERGRVLDETVVEVRREGVDGRRLVRAGEVEEAEAKERIRVDDHDFFDPHWTTWTSVAESTPTPSCAICSKPVDTDDHLSFLLCTSSSSGSSSSAASPSPSAPLKTSCTSTFHLPCLAAHFLSTPSPSSAASSSTLPLPSAAPVATISPPLVPTSSSCPSCHSSLHWADLIRASYRRKEEQEGRRKRRTFEKGSKDPEARKRKKRVATGAEGDGEKTKGRKPRGRGKGKAAAAVDSGSEDEERFDFRDEDEDDGAESVDLDEVGEEDDEAFEEQERSWAQSAAAEGAFLDDLDLEGGGGGDMDVDDWIEDAPPPPVSPKKRGRPPKPKSTAASPPRTAPTTSPRRRTAATKKSTKASTLTSMFGSSKASLSTSAAGAAGGKGKTHAVRPPSDSEDDFLAPPSQLGRKEPEKGKEKAPTARKKKVLEYVELSD